MVDPGKFNKNQEVYEELAKKIYQKYDKGIKLPPEYASFVNEDLNRFLIRLARYKFIAKQINKNDTVLEVGCGSGLGTIFLSQYSKKVIGIDIKTSEIEEAKSISIRENIVFICDDFFSHNFESKFDVIVNLDVIEHMNQDLGELLIQKISKSLEDNGMAIIGTPSYYSWPHQGALSKASHVKCYDLPELETLVQKFFGRTLSFSMNDEVVHTGHYKMAWYYFILAFYPKES